MRHLLISVFGNRVLILLENTVMEDAPLNDTFQYLGISPILVDAKNISAASRPRLWWTDVQIDAFPGEHIAYGRFPELILAPCPSRLQVLQPDYRFHVDFSENLSCITGLC